MSDQPRVAIVAAGCVMPTGLSPEHLWQAVLASKDMARDVPAGRWLLPAPVAFDPVVGRMDRVYSRRGCFVDPFTPDLDGLELPREFLAELDPVFHLVLEAGRQAWQAAQTQSVDRRRVGVILGNIALPTEHASDLARTWLGRTFEEKALSQPLPCPFVTPPRHCTSLPAAMLARALCLGGGSFTLDAACASSLYAIKLAADELRAGRADAMLAGGVSRPDCLYTQMGFSQLRALSPSGVCRPFDAAADGLVVGEGAGIFMLKRLDDALAQGDVILAVLVGAGLSNDVAGGLLAPASEGQLRALHAAYREANWQPTDVDLIECHATGTPVGDRTELESLRSLWGPRTPRHGPCILGSVKSTVGHMLTAAGAAALMKVLQAFRAGLLPPTANFQSPTASLERDDSPFQVLTQAQPWERRRPGVPRRAAVSGFGFGGVNAHLLLEEYLDPGPKPARVQVPATPPVEIAVVGLDVRFGPWTTLQEFQDRVLGGTTFVPTQPPAHWWGVPHSEWFQREGLGAENFRGWFLEGPLRVAVDRFRIPPRELAQMLPQQLLLLEVAAGALDQVAIPEERRIRTATYVGLEIDLNTTNFHFRWSVLARAMAEAARRGVSPDRAAPWVRELADAAGPPLTADRTMGALGSVAASRVAREFRLGGPSFTLSAEEASGLRAVELAVRALQRGEIDQALVGAVDLAGDVRAVLARHAHRPFSASGIPRPFDADADGSVPGEGAAAVVLKRLSDALADGDAVYAVMRGVGVAGDTIGAEDQYRAALQRAYEEARVDPGSVDYLEAHGSGHPAEDAAEMRAIGEFFGPLHRPRPLRVGSVKADIGHTGAAAGLASFVRACLSLSRQLLPPLRNMRQPCRELAAVCEYVDLIRETEAWLQESSKGPRRAGVSALGSCCTHLVLEAAPAEAVQPPLVLMADSQAAAPRPVPTVEVSIGGGPFVIPPPPWRAPVALEGPDRQISAGCSMPTAIRSDQAAALGASLAKGAAGSQLDGAIAARRAIADAHQSYLCLSEAFLEQLRGTANFQTSLLEASLRSGIAVPMEDEPAAEPCQGVFFDREACLRFARGRIGELLGPAYAVIDSHPSRVRLPDEPLLLVDRILSVEGEPLSLCSGRVVTEHDVRPGAWYLDGGRAPACIAIEAGQADLFLSAYLGIDLRTRGRAVYRLLDAAVTFYRGLPRPGDVLRYDIHIDRFFRQGDTHLFRFRFDGTVNGQPLLTMTDGCAGFFSALELAAGRGVVQAPLAQQRRAGKAAPGEEELAPPGAAQYSDAQVDALRCGDLEAAFGPAFARLTLAEGLRLPSGRMRVIHRVSRLDPAGGRFGIGLIRAEADVHPDDWFLTCHFVDDQVMPGTLMYECCLHTLRIFLLRLGWVATSGEAACEPVPGVTSRLRCRGQVTAATRTVSYEVVLKERGYRPEPYAIADALLYADGRPIVEINDMCLRLEGLSRESITDLWAQQRARPATVTHATVPPHSVVFSRERILAFAVGKPSEAFGEPYRIFDSGRFVARLPGPPYQFIDRIVRVQAEPFKMVSGGVAWAEYDVPPDAWYFAAERQPVMPYAVLLEVALQSCGWLAAYVGSALTSPEDLCFRNLGGEAVMHGAIGPDAGTLTAKVQLSNVASSAGMILQHFDFDVLGREGPVYSGKTSFGFFTRAALAQQVGIHEASLYELTPAQRQRARAFPFPNEAPFPDRMLRMLDCVDKYVPDGGPAGLGLIEGSKEVDPQEWYFKAHFFEDPVWPGSLGLEAFLQLLKVAMVQRWGLGPGTRFRLRHGSAHRWRYRGQVVPSSRAVLVQALITAIGAREVTADGWLQADGRIIYEMRNFSLEAF